MLLHRFLSAAFAIGIAVAVLACQTPVEREPISVAPVKFGSNEHATIERVYIVTDASGSMFDGGSSEAKALTWNVIANLPDQQEVPYQVGWIAYGGSKQVVVPLAPLDRPALQQRVANTGRVGGIFGVGGTTLTHRVFESLADELQGKSGKTAIILITDGEDDYPVHTYRRAKKLVEQQNGNVCIHTVQVGDRRSGTVLNRALANMNPCGSSRFAAQIAAPADVGLLSRDLFALEAVGLPGVAEGPPETSP